MAEAGKPASFFMPTAHHNSISEMIVFATFIPLYADFFVLH
jgi:hypothetical protein